MRQNFSVPELSIREFHVFQTHQKIMSDGNFHTKILFIQNTIYKYIYIYADFDCKTFILKEYLRCVYRHLESQCLIISAILALTARTAASYDTLNYTIKFITYAFQK
jgi:hypothetical protein